MGDLTIHVREDEVIASKRIVWIAGVLAGLVGCGRNEDGNVCSEVETEPSVPRFLDVTSEALPAVVHDGPSMDAAAFDADEDGDLDLLIAREFEQNVLLLGRGDGRFTDATARLPAAEHDSEQIAVHDFNGDAVLDAVVVSEDDSIDELYLGDGRGGFVDGSTGLPEPGVSNAVSAGDVTGDGLIDLVVGNNGQNAVWIGDGRGRFVDEAALRAPTIDDITQDVELADVDADGDLDVGVANVGDDPMWLNDGTGHFSLGELPTTSEPTETREVDLGDVDGDGDVDLVFGNTHLSLPSPDPQNRLLLNDGRGRFSDVTAERLPVDADRTMEIDLSDIDGDGDLDIMTGNRGDERGPAPYGAYENDGLGFFVEVTAAWLPCSAVGHGFDIVSADFDRDGRLDLYLASRVGSDRLLLARE